MRPWLVQPDCPLRSQGKPPRAIRALAQRAPGGLGAFVDSRADRRPTRHHSPASLQGRAARGSVFPRKVACHPASAIHYGPRSPTRASALTQRGPWIRFRLYCDHGGRPDQPSALRALWRQDEGRSQHPSPRGDATPRAPPPVHRVRPHRAPRKPRRRRSSLARWPRRLFTGPPSAISTS